MDCEQTESSSEIWDPDAEEIQHTAAADSNFENADLHLPFNNGQSATKQKNLQSDARYTELKENFYRNLRNYETREWCEEEHNEGMQDVDLCSVLWSICRTKPLDLNSSDALSFFVNAALISSIDPSYAARISEALGQWTERRRDPMRMYSLLAREISEDLVRKALSGNLHFRSDFGRNPAEALTTLMERNRIFRMEKGQLHKKIKSILSLLKHRGEEFVVQTLLRIWYVYCDQDEGDLEVFRSFYPEYCARFDKPHCLYAWDTGIQRMKEQNSVDLYLCDPLETLCKWAEEDEINASERFHSSKKPFCDADSIAREFNLTVQDQCVRELSLMGAFDFGDPRTKSIFTAVKSLRIGDIYERTYLNEWCSRSPTYPGHLDVKKLLETCTCDLSFDQSLNLLYCYRRENPVVSFRASTPLQEASPGQKKPEENRNKSKRAATTLQNTKNKKKTNSGNSFPGLGNTDTSASQQPSTDQAEAERKAEEERKAKDERKATEVRILHRMLHSVDVRRSSWACVLSVAYQLHPDNKQEIFDFIHENYTIDRPVLEARWNAKHSNCLDWGRFLKQHLDVKLSGDGLITQTLPEICGDILRYVLFCKSGCMILRFEIDAIPFRTSDLNLNTGLIDNDETLNLNLISGDADCSDYRLAEILITHHLNRRLGCCDENYYQFTERNGSWNQTDKDQAQSMVSEELKVLISRTLHLCQFREKMGLHDVKSIMFSKTMKRYCMHYGVKDVLKAIKPLINFTPPEENPHLACFANGLVDLRSKVMLGPAKPEDYVIRSIPHPYDPNADQSLITLFFQSLFPEGVYDDPSEIQDFFQMHIGSFLTGKTVMPAVLLCIGEGSNGKSAYNQIISKALGKDYHAMIAAEALQKEPGTNNDNLYRARHARCATIMEVERGKKLNAKMLKNLTGGDDTEFSAKFMKGTCERTNMKLHVFANDVPEFTAKLSDDFGLSRRIAIVPFRVQFLDDNDTVQREKLSLSGCAHWAFPKNEALIAQVISNGIPGLLAFMVDGASRLLAQDSQDLKLKLPHTIRITTHQEKVEDFDELVRFFVEEHLERVIGCPGDCCKKKTFISTFEITHVYKQVERKEACLFKDTVFKTKLRMVIDDVFKNQIEGRDLNVWYDKRKGVPSPDGKKEMRGYYNLQWKKDSAGLVEANKLKETYRNA